MSQVFLPDGVALAPVGRRIGEWFLRIVLVVVTLVIGYIIWDLILWNQGQDPAKKLLKMRCWKPAEGKVAGWGTMLLRNFVGGIVEGLTILILLLSFIFLLARKDHRALHDLIGGTVVVYDPTDVLARR
jgi:uncharacterized RDD family membrane protein YckC